MTTVVRLGGREFVVIQPSCEAVRRLAAIVRAPDPGSDLERLQEYGVIARIAIPSLTDEELGKATFPELQYLRDVIFKMAGFERLN